MRVNNQRNVVASRMNTAISHYYVFAVSISMVSCYLHIYSYPIQNIPTYVLCMYPTFVLLFCEITIWLIRNFNF